MRQELSNQMLVELLQFPNEATSTDLFKALCASLKCDVSSGAFYTTMDRLITKGFVTRREGEPQAKRGGRRRYHYKITNQGRAALIELHKRTTTLQTLLAKGLLPGTI